MDPVVISLLCVWGLAWVFFIAQIVRTSQQQAANGGIFIVGPNNGKVRREKHGVFIAQRRTASLPLSSPTRTHTLHRADGAVISTVSHRLYLLQRRINNLLTPSINLLKSLIACISYSAASSSIGWLRKETKKEERT